MLNWLLWGLVAGGVAAVVMIEVRYLNKALAKQELKDRNIPRAVVRNIVRDPGVAHISLEGWDEYGNENKIQIDADDYDPDEIKPGTVIYV